MNMNSRKRSWATPQLKKFGALATMTAAGNGTIAELGYLYTKGAKSCANPNSMATSMVKHPCG